MKLNSNTIVKKDCFKIIKDNQRILKQLDGKRILITGANGFLMSYLVDVIAYWNHFFSKKKCLIFALDNSSNFKRLSYLKGRKDIKLINQDICNIKRIDKKPYHYDIIFKVKGEGNRIFSVSLVYEKVIDTSSPGLRLL